MLDLSRISAGRLQMQIEEFDAPAVLDEVVDHGIGIAEEDQKRIFERFQKLANGGSGVDFSLGLWIAREVVRALHGEIRVSSELGMGSTFLVKLPKLISVETAGPAG